MTEKRFRKGKSILTDFPTGAIIDKKTGERYYDGIKPNYISSKELVKLLNELHEENEQLKTQLQNTSNQRDEFHRGVRENANRVGKLEKENEQLKQDNNALIHLLENQSIIIQELYSKLLEYQVKEPIVLTKEDLELMGKALSYYTHGKCGE